ncbi:PREDICTED: LOC109946465 [Prunus dulcis]|uniref:PREDICTED: LOC109946465 n=1 Tax=Prunus dulcis TaxID=3755 RepID=A0A5E4G9F4_PRUDU|nr:PREDICTED: LOC109946465 [Prunus dulcis]
MAHRSIASRFLRSIVFDNDVLDDQYEDDLLARIEAVNLANEGRTSRRHGSIEGRVVVPRYIARGGRNLYEDYFVDPPVIVQYDGLDEYFKVADAYMDIILQNVFCFLVGGFGRGEEYETEKYDIT